MASEHTKAPLHEERSTLASSTARRQIAQLSWSMFGGVVLLLSYGIGMWLHWQGWATYQFPQTVLWCTAPYVLAAHWIYRGAGLPSAEHASLLLVTTVTPFLLLLLGFALFQQPYSRGAVLLVYLLSTAWFALGDWLRGQQSGQRLVYLDRGIPEFLQAWCGSSVLRNYDLELMPWHAPESSTEFLQEIDGVVLDRQTPTSTERSLLLAKLKINHIRIYSVEAIAELLSGRKMLPTTEDALWQMDGNPAYDAAKRAMDVCLVLLTVPLWLPLCCAVAIAVRLDSTGSVFFSQLRVGRNGRVFRLWKFRSMQHDLRPASAQFAQLHDQRVTRVGRVIRRWRLDELPQLLNVLLGHMSLIGPRPEQADFVNAFATRIPAYTYRHLVRPGITGWAQLQHGYTDSEEGTMVKLSYDLYYVANYSVALDLLIYYKTIRIVLSGFGAR